MKFAKIIGLGVLVSFFGTAGGSVVLADGGDTTLIHACVAKDGTMRNVSATTSCKNNETALHWATSARIVTGETRITNTETKNTAQDSSISAIQTKNTQQDADIAALQGQVGGGTSGLVVKDSGGQVVGKFIDLGSIFLRIGNVPLYVQVAPNGFVVNGNGVSFYHTTDDCSGTRYMVSNRGGGFTDFIETFDGQTGYYPAELTQDQLFVQSQEIVHSSQDLTGVGFCNSFSPQLLPAAAPAIVNFNTLGTPPFYLE